MNRKSKQSTRAKGESFEKLAEEFLVREGFRILERNWQAGHKEIDIIATKENLVAFVEVKGSRSGEYGHPSEWVDRHKRENLVQAAQQFIIEHELIGFDFRFDLITFFEGKLEHYPDAFQMESD